jgi:hypothetical protein
MNHEEAKKMMAAEAYVLDDLPETERAAFEEHYFDCTDCTADVLDAATIADGVRTRSTSNVIPMSKRFNWWAVAASVLAAGLSYQTLVVMPRAIQMAERHQSAQSARMVASAQITAPSRGDDAINTVTVRAGEPVVLDFPFVPTIRGPYRGEIRDAAGKIVAGPFAVAESAELSHLFVAADTLHDGTYTLVIRGGGGDEAIAYRFTVSQ